MDRARTIDEIIDGTWRPIPTKEQLEDKTMKGFETEELLAKSGGTVTLDAVMKTPFGPVLEEMFQVAVVAEDPNVQEAAAPLLPTPVSLAPKPAVVNSALTQPKGVPPVTAARHAFRTETVRTWHSAPITRVGEAVIVSGGDVEDITGPPMTLKSKYETACEVLVRCFQPLTCTVPGDKWRNAEDRTVPTDESAIDVAPLLASHDRSFFSTGRAMAPRGAFPATYSAGITIAPRPMFRSTTRQALLTALDARYRLGHVYVGTKLALDGRVSRPVPTFEGTYPNLIPLCTARTRGVQNRPLHFYEGEFIEQGYQWIGKGDSLTLHVGTCQARFDQAFESLPGSRDAIGLTRRYLQSSSVAGGRMREASYSHALNVIGPALPHAQAVSVGKLTPEATASMSALQPAMVADIVKIVATGVAGYGSRIVFSNVPSLESADSQMGSLFMARALFTFPMLLSEEQFVMGLELALLPWSRDKDVAGRFMSGDLSFVAAESTRTRTRIADRSTIKTLNTSGQRSSLSALRDLLVEARAKGGGTWRMCGACVAAGKGARAAKDKPCRAHSPEFQLTVPLLGELKDDIIVNDYGQRLTRIGKEVDLFQMSQTRTMWDIYLEALPQGYVSIISALTHTVSEDRCQFGIGALTIRSLVAAQDGCLEVLSPTSSPQYVIPSMMPFDAHVDLHDRYIEVDYRCAFAAATYCIDAPTDNGYLIEVPPPPIGGTLDACDAVYALELSVLTWLYAYKEQVTIGPRGQFPFDGKSLLSRNRELFFKTVSDILSKIFAKPDPGQRERLEFWVSEMLRAPSTPLFTSVPGGALGAGLLKRWFLSDIAENLLWEHSSGAVLYHTPRQIAPQLRDARGDPTADLAETVLSLWTDPISYDGDVCVEVKPALLLQWPAQDEYTLSEVISRAESNRGGIVTMATVPLLLVTDKLIVTTTEAPPASVTNVGVRVKPYTDLEDAPTFNVVEGVTYVSEPRLPNARTALARADVTYATTRHGFITAGTKPLSRTSPSEMTATSLIIRPLRTRLQGTIQQFDYQYDRRIAVKFVPLTLTLPSPEGGSTVLEL